MDNYKIKVKDETESKEAQELFFELGYVWIQHGKSYIPLGSDCTHLTVYSDGRLAMGVGDAKKELTLPQLRDLVVLKRNDVKDANYKLFISPSQGYLSLYKASDDVFYAYASKSKCWDKSRSVTIITENLEAIPKEKDQGLISGAEALRALADGKVVLGKAKDYESEWFDAKHWTLTAFLEDTVHFKLKPTTLTINAELPKPSNTTLHNQNYSVTYEFKTREDRNAFVEGLGGNNS